MEPGKRMRVIRAMEETTTTQHKAKDKGKGFIKINI